MRLRLTLPDRDELVSTAVTLALATFGGIVFFHFGLPAAWLSGAMVGATCGIVFGVRLHVPDWLRQVTMLVLGASMGVSVTPATLHTIGQWPTSLAVLAITIAAIIMAAIVVGRLFGWDRDTAIYASAPGALSTVLILAEASGADMRRVVIAQSSRLFILVAILPFVLSLIDPHASASFRPAPIGLDSGPVDYLLLLVVSAAGALAARLVRAPAPLLIGAAIASSIVHGADLIEAPVPVMVQIPSFIILGAFMGLRFRGTTLAILRSEIGASLLICLSSSVVALVGAFLVHQILGVRLAETMVAFAPGGIEAMTIIAFSLSLDVAFVGTHHLVRFLGIAVALPVVSRLLNRA